MKRNIPNLFKLLGLLLVVILPNLVFSQELDFDRCTELLNDFKNKQLQLIACQNGMIECTDSDARIAVHSRNAAFNLFSASIPECSVFFVKQAQKKERFVLSCPADALITNSAGKQIGWKNGNLINDIPNAEKSVDEESEMYVLPSNDAYMIEIFGTGQGSAEVFTIIDQDDGGHIAYYFDPISLHSGIKYAGMLKAGGMMGSLSSGTATYTPRSKRISASDPMWSKIQAIGKNDDKSNGAPVASFSVMPENLTTESQLVLVSTAYDPDNDAMTYEWYVDGRFAGKLRQHEENPLSQGSHIIRLKVTDSKGEFHEIERTLHVIQDDSGPRNESTPWWKIEESTLEEIMNSLPYVLAGLVGLLILRSLFRRKKNRNYSNKSKRRNYNVPPTPTTYKKVPEDDGWVDVDAQFCTQCGNVLNPGTIFCGQCGAKLEN